MIEANIKPRPIGQPKISNRAIGPNAVELIDTLADTAQVITLIVRALADGFQLNDVFTIITQEPVIREIIDDTPAALNAFSELSPTDARNVVIRLKQELISRIGVIDRPVNIILNGLYAGANTYAFIIDTLRGAKRQFDEYGMIVSDFSIVPDEEISEV